jgi:hypothetical protein
MSELSDLVGIPDKKTFDLMTSVKGLSCFTTPLILGISLISLSGLDVHAQGT